MRAIAHISDLHFGRTDPAVLEGLRQGVLQAEPDVVVVSGDLTQRARSTEFKQARDYLSTLPVPQIVVPGNHDVPLYNVFKRSLKPLTNFRRYITDELAPFHADDEIAVLGLNTARALTFKNGRISRDQVRDVRARFARTADGALRVVVTHHPFAVPESDTGNVAVGRAKMAMAAFADCKIDVVLSGHLHLSGATTSEALFPGAHASLLVQAGTATSTRLRQETNTFNLLRVDGDNLAIERHAWTTADFAVDSSERFRRASTGWVADG